MGEKLSDIRRRLDIVSQGHVRSANAVTVHLAFRLSAADAERLIRHAAEQGISESLWARTAVLEQLAKETHGP